MDSRGLGGAQLRALWESRLRFAGEGGIAGGERRKGQGNMARGDGHAEHRCSRDLPLFPGQCRRGEPETVRCEDRSVFLGQRIEGMEGQSQRAPEAVMYRFAPGPTKTRKAPSGTIETKSLGNNH